MASYFVILTLAEKHRTCTSNSDTESETYAKFLGKSLRRSGQMGGSY